MVDPNAKAESSKNLVSGHCLDSRRMCFPAHCNCNCLMCAPKPVQAVKKAQ